MQAGLGEEVDGTGSSRKVQKTLRGTRTHCNVTGLLKMKSVDPRVIAYTACQVRAMHVCLLIDLTIPLSSFISHYPAPHLGI